MLGQTGRTNRRRQRAPTVLRRPPVAFRDRVRRPCPLHTLNTSHLVRVLRASQLGQHTVHRDGSCEGFSREADVHRLLWQGTALREIHPLRTRSARLKRRHEEYHDHQGTTLHHASPRACPPAEPVAVATVRTRNEHQSASGDAKYVLPSVATRTMDCSRPSWSGLRSRPAISPLRDPRCTEDAVIRIDGLSSPPRVALPHKWNRSPPPLFPSRVPPCSARRLARRAVPL